MGLSLGLLRVNRVVSCVCNYLSRSERLSLTCCVCCVCRARLRALPQISADVEEQRALLAKDWARYKSKQHLQDLQMIDRLMFAQQKALDELRNESEELYQEAIQVRLYV